MSRERSESRLERCLLSCCESVIYGFGNANSQVAVWMLHQLMHNEVTAPVPSRVILISRPRGKPPKEVTILSVASGLGRIVSPSVKRVGGGRDPRAFQRASLSILSQVLLGILGEDQ